MQLESILLGRAIRLLHISSASKGRIYGLHLVRACEERYGFWQGPRTVDDFDLAKGVTFLHGHFQSRLVIDKFQVFQNGMLAEAKADTNECDAFLDEFVGWIQSEFGISLNEESSSPRFYQSNLEIRGSF